MLNAAFVVFDLEALSVLGLLLPSLTASASPAGRLEAPKKRVENVSVEGLVLRKRVEAGLAASAERGHSGAGARAIGSEFRAAFPCFNDRREELLYHSRKTRARARAAAPRGALRKPGSRAREGHQAWIRLILGSARSPTA